MNKNIETIKKEGFADYATLRPYLAKVINKGLNAFGLRDCTLILTDGSNWDYTPEDGIFELNTSENTVEVVDLKI